MDAKDKLEINTTYGLINSKYGIDYQNLMPALLKTFWYVGTEETKKLNVDNAQLKYYSSDEEMSARIEILLPDNEGYYSVVGIIDIPSEKDKIYFFFELDSEYPISDTQHGISNLQTPSE